MMCFLWENMGFCVRKSAHIRMTLRLNWLSATGSCVKCSDCRCTEAVILSRELEFITSYLDVKLWAAQLLYGCDRSGGGIKANKKHLSPVSEALGFEVWNLGGNNPKWRCRALFWRNSGGFFKDQLLSVCSTCPSPRPPPPTAPGSQQTCCCWACLWRGEEQEWGCDLSALLFTQTLNP